VSTDAGWGDYLSSGTSAADAGQAASAEASASAAAAADDVQGEVAAAADDADWSNWHANQGDSASDSADFYVQQAADNVADGNFGAAYSDLNAAQNFTDIANSNYDSSADYADDAATHAGYAADAAADATSYTDAGTE
jgi:hypothetical protein